MLVTDVGDETCWWHILDDKSKRCHQDLHYVTNIQTWIRQHHDVTNIIVAIFQVRNNTKGVTVEFIESEYDKVIYQAFIKPRNK